jgi:hypothetical protein
VANFVSFFEAKLDEAKYFLDLMRQHEATWRQATAKSDARGLKKASEKYGFALSAFVSACYSAVEFVIRAEQKSDLKRQWLKNKCDEPIYRFFRELRKDFTHNWIPVFIRKTNLEYLIEIDVLGGSSIQHPPTELSRSEPFIALGGTAMPHGLRSLYQAVAGHGAETQSVTELSAQFYTVLRELLMYGVGEGHLP